MDRPASLEENARRITAASVRHGAGTGGDPAITVSELYRGVCQALYTVTTDCGTDAMMTAAALAESAIDAGLIYVGDETLDFIRRVGASASATHKDLMKAPHRP